MKSQTRIALIVARRFVTERYGKINIPVSRVNVASFQIRSFVNERVIKSGSWIEAKETDRRSRKEATTTTGLPVDPIFDPEDKDVLSLSAFPPLFFSVPSVGEKATRGKADNGMENNGTRGTSTRRTNLEIMNQS